MQVDEATETATPAAGPEDFAAFEKWRETGELPEATETKEAPAAPPETEEAKTAPATEPEKKQEEPEGDQVPEGVQKRIDKAVRKQREAEREAEAARAELARLRAAAEKPAAPAEGKPKVSDFADYDDYVEAVADWKADQKIAAQQKAQETAKAEEAKRTAAETFQKRIAEAKKRPEYADIDEVLDSDVTVSPTVHEAMLMSDKGAELAYWLGKNPEEAARISALKPVAAAVALGEIIATFKTPPPEPPRPKASAAPAPIKPLGGKSGKSASVTDSELPYEDWERTREEQLLRRR